MAGGPLKETGVTPDGVELWKNVNDLQKAIDDLNAKLVKGTGSPSSELSGPEPADPFIVDEEVKHRSVRDTMAFTFGGPATEIGATIRRILHPRSAMPTLGPKIHHAYKHVSQAERDAGAIDWQFPDDLHFNATYNLTHCHVADALGNRSDNPDTDTTDADDLIGLATFVTGPGQRSKPGRHNYIRNGRFERSKAAWKKEDPVVGQDGKECYAWFINCRHDSPVTTSTHASPSGDPQWDKAGGTLQWTSEAKRVSQRFRHRHFRGGERLYWDGKVALSSFGLPINYDLLVELLYIADSVNMTDGTPIVVASTLTTNIGNQPTSSPGMFTAIPGPPPPVLLDLSYKEILVPLDVDPGYLLSSTPSSADGTNNGQWLRLTIQNLSGSNTLDWDEFRVGRDPAGWSPHPSEESATDEGDAIGDVDIDNGTGRSQQGVDEFDADSGHVLRDITEVED